MQVGRFASTYIVNAKKITELYNIKTTSIL